MARTIITYGTFDMFHIGHLNLLRRLKEMGDKLIVAVSTDEFNELKGKQVIIPYEQRAQIVQAIEYVDEVIPEQSWEQKKSDVSEYAVDVFAIGKEWEGEFDFLKPQCEVVYLERTSGISTTALKGTLKRFVSIPREDLQNAFEVLELLRRDLE